MYVASNKKSSIRVHVSADHHKAKMELWIARKKKSTEVGESLLSYYREHKNEKLASLPLNELVFRYQVMKTFMKSGTPSERFQYFSPILSKAQIDLGDPSELKMFIPKVEQSELSRLMDEVAKQYVSGHPFPCPFC